MHVAHQLTFCRKSLQRPALKHGVVTLNAIENLRLKHHESCVDGRAVAGILFAEGMYGIISTNIQYALLLL